MSASAPDPLATTLAEDLRLLLDGRHHDPRCILGRHIEADRCTVRILIPGARAAWLVPLNVTLQRWGETDLFCWTGRTQDLPAHYAYRWEDEAGSLHERRDAYDFPLVLKEDELAQFHQGRQ